MEKTSLFWFVIVFTIIPFCIYYLSYLQIMKIKKGKIEYNPEMYKESQMFAKLMLYLFIFSIIGFAFWCFIILTYSPFGIHTIFLILFGLTFPIGIYSTYYYHKNYLSLFASNNKEENLKPKS